MALGLLFSLLVVQIPCAPGIDSTLSCQCKQGVASACTVLWETDPKLAQQIANAVAAAAAAVATKGGDKTSAKLGADCGDPNNCNGQEHHIISRRIAWALDAHKTLTGKYTARDPRFVSRAKDKNAHCGYWGWHEKLDNEVVEWLRRNKEVTSREFEAYLRELYKRPDLLARFPNGF